MVTDKRAWLRDRDIISVVNHKDKKTDLLEPCKR